MTIIRALLILAALVVGENLEGRHRLRPRPTLRYGIRGRERLVNCSRRYFDLQLAKDGNFLCILGLQDSGAFLC
jgi:hypothetical protein